MADPVEHVPLSDLAAPKGLIGGPFGSSLGRKDYVSAGVPVIRGQNLVGLSSPFDLGEFVYVTKEKVEDELARNLAVPGDVVFTQRGTLGQVGLVPKGPHKRYVISQSQMRFRADPTKVLPEYVYYCFRDPNMVELIERRAIVTGVPHINLSILATLPVPYRRLTEQRAIAEVLGALDDKIECNSRIARLLEDRLAVLFEALGFDEPGGDGVRLDHLFELNPQRPKPRTEAAPYIDMAALPTESALVPEVSERPPKSGTRFVNGDTVMARITPCLENGKTAYIDCLADDEVGVGSTEFIVLRPQSELPSQLAYFLAKTPRFRNFAVRHMSGSSGRQRCQADALAGYRLGPPKPGSVACFGEQVEPCFARMRSGVNESTVLVNLRDTLLPRLLSGELRVRGAEAAVEGAV